MTEDWEAEAIQYLRDRDKEDRRRILRKAFIDPCRDETNWCLPRWQEYLYAIKIWLCALLGLEKVYSWSDDVIEVVTIESHQLYAGWSARFAVVGLGLFSNWGYEIHEDGDWWM